MLGGARTVESAFRGEREGGTWTNGDEVTGMLILGGRAKCAGHGRRVCGGRGGRRSRVLSSMSLLKRHNILEGRLEGETRRGPHRGGMSITGYTSRSWGVCLGGPFTFFLEKSTFEVDIFVSSAQVLSLWCKAPALSFVTSGVSKKTR